MIAATTYHCAPALCHRECGLRSTAHRRLLLSLQLLPFVVPEPKGLRQFRKALLRGLPVGVCCELRPRRLSVARSAIPSASRRSAHVAQIDRKATLVAWRWSPAEA